MRRPPKDAIALNCAIIEAFGLDPENIAAHPLPTITLDKHLGPILTVAYFCYDQAGEKFVLHGEVARILRKFKLVPIEDEASDET